MRYLVLSVLLLVNSVVWAASGNKPNQMVLPFRNVSSSTKPANCIPGEQKQNSTYVFTCNSSSHWRRTALGNGF